jgi:hypothetical protein
MWHTSPHYWSWPIRTVVSVPEHGAGRSANRLRCRTGGAAFTVVGAPAHREANGMVVGAGDSIPRRHVLSGAGSAH